MDKVFIITNAIFNFSQQLNETQMQAASMKRKKKICASDHNHQKI